MLRWAVVSSSCTAPRTTDSAVCVLDTNAKVGSAVSPGVGSFGADKQSVGGEELHSFLLRFGLAFPDIFGSVQKAKTKEDVGFAARLYTSH